MSLEAGRKLLEWFPDNFSEVFDQKAARPPRSNKAQKPPHEDK